MTSTTQFRNDGALVNVVTGMGGEKDVTQHTRVGAAPYLSDRALEELACVWPLNKICTAYPDAMTGKGWELTWPEGTDQKIKDAFTQYRSVIGTRTKENDLRDEELASDVDLFREAMYLANVYRGAALVLNVDDGRHPSEPIDTKNIRTIREVTALDSCDIYPDLSAIHNPLKATHYNLIVDPSRYPMVKEMFAQGRAVARTGGYYTYGIHRSRVIRFPGMPIPTRKKQYYNGWDGSLLESVWDKYVAWEETTNAIQNLMSDYSLFVYKLQGLRDLVSEGNEDALRARINLLRRAAKVLGGVVMDKDDEDIGFIQRTFSGLDSLLDKFRDVFIGASDIPHTILFGESPSGLGATGESEEKTWAGNVGDRQTKIMLPRLMRLYQLIFLAKDGPTQGKPLQGWGIKFHPLMVQSQSEILADRATQAQIDQTYHGMEAVITEEIRNSRHGGAEYSFETTLDPEAWEAKQQEGQADPANPDSTQNQNVGPAPEPEPEVMSLKELRGLRGDSLRIWTRQDAADPVAYDQARRSLPFKRADSAFAQYLLKQKYRQLAS